MPKYTADSVAGTPPLARGLSAARSIATTEPHQGSPNAALLTCYWCGTIDSPRGAPSKGPHFAAAVCASWGVFIRWILRYSPVEREAQHQQARLAAMAQRPPSPLPLAYLQALGDSGPPPANMAEASQRIDALKDGRVA